MLLTDSVKLATPGRMSKYDVNGDRNSFKATCHERLQVHGGVLMAWKMSGYLGPTMSSKDTLGIGCNIGDGYVSTDRHKVMQLKSFVVVTGR